MHVNERRNTWKRIMNDTSEAAPVLVFPPGPDPSENEWLSSFSIETKRVRRQAFPSRTEYIFPESSGEHLHRLNHTTNEMQEGASALPGLI
jgi:hypothetical protein